MLRFVVRWQHGREMFALIPFPTRDYKRLAAVRPFLYNSPLCSQFRVPFLADGLLVSVHPPCPTGISSRCMVSHRAQNLSLIGPWKGCPYIVRSLALDAAHL